MKLTVQRITIFLLLAAISIGVGFGYDAVATAVEKRNHPMPNRYVSIIEEQSEEFGVPPAVIYAVIRCESDFVSDLSSDDGKIGLMQISPQLLETVYDEIFHEPIPDYGILYDPKTNLRVGTAWLSHLYQRYGVWETVYAAWSAGTDTTDEWLSNDTVVNEQGRLEQIPNKATAKFVTHAKKSEEMYQKLYFASQLSES